jgi:hypothetical protein
LAEYRTSDCGSQKSGEEKARLLRALEANEKLSLHLQIGFSLKLPAPVEIAFYWIFD